MNLKEAKSTRLMNVEGLVNFEKYSIDTDGWNQFVLDAKELFSSRDADTKKAIRQAGGYPAIFDVADLYFEQEFSTVNFVTTNFHLICKTESFLVVGDSSGYRFKIAERYSDEWDRFAYPSDFISAYDLVLTNREIYR